MTLNFKSFVSRVAATLSLLLAAAGASAQTTGADSIDQGTVDTTGIDNLVTVTGDYGGATVTNDAFEEVLVIAALPAIEVTKEASVSADVNVGDVITYEYVITNTGNVVIDGVTIDDDHYTGSGQTSLIVSNCIVTDATVTAGDGSTLNENDTVLVSGGGTANDVFTTFGPGDVATCDATYVVTQADVDNLQ